MEDKILTFLDSHIQNKSREMISLVDKFVLYWQIFQEDWSPEYWNFYNKFSLINKTVDKNVNLNSNNIPNNSNILLENFNNKNNINNNNNQIATLLKFDINNLNNNKSLISDSKCDASNSFVEKENNDQENPKGPILPYSDENFFRINNKDEKNTIHKNGKNSKAPPLGDKINKGENPYNTKEITKMNKYGTENSLIPLINQIDMEIDNQQYSETETVKNKNVKNKEKIEEQKNKQIKNKKCRMCLDCSPF